MNSGLGRDAHHPAVANSSRARMPVQLRLVPGPGVAPISCWASRAISTNAFIPGYENSPTIHICL